MEQGIIVGCDRNQEWLLPWWWRHYSACNAFPVVFIDFGMSEGAKSWCGEKGRLIPFSTKMPKILKRSVSSEMRSLWEEHYGKKIWLFRKIWFQKPFALLLSPFCYTIWLDLDVQVNKNLGPLFYCIALGIEIALKRDSEEIQKLHRKRGYIAQEEVNYDCGLIPFRKNAPILTQWTQEIIERNELYVFDQQALSRALSTHRPSFFELPELYNWSAGKGFNADAFAIHYHGGILKGLIKQQERQC